MLGDPTRTARLAFFGELGALELLGGKKRWVWNRPIYSPIDSRRRTWYVNGELTLVIKGGAGKWGRASPWLLSLVARFLWRGNSGNTGYHTPKQW